jgi:integrase
MKTMLEHATTSHLHERQRINAATCPPDVENFIQEALAKRKKSLIQFAVTSQTVTEMAKYLKRHCSQSSATAYLYIWSVQRYCEWRKSNPDHLINECFLEDDLPNQKALQLEARALYDFIGSLQSEEYSPGHIANCVKAVKTLFRINGLNLCLPYKLHKYVVTKDRAPTPEELSRLVDVADIRGKLIVAVLAQGGFRIGTLCKLRYRHVKEDLERNVIPIHIHVETKITKGKYHDYDTFLGREAVDYLKAYLAVRKTGGLQNKIPPESLQDESPLIRNEHSRCVATVSPGQVYNILHRLMDQAGFLGSKIGRRYTVRPHSIRKFFRTQMAALGVQTDYIEYMMEHTISTYHDIEMKGVEFLRAEYARSSLSINPRRETSKMAIVRDFLKSAGLKPEEVLSKEAQAMPHRTVVAYPHRLSEQEEIEVMLRALMQKLKQEIVAETQLACRRTV